MKDLKFKLNVIYSGKIALGSVFEFLTIESAYGYEKIFPRYRCRHMRVLIWDLFIFYQCIDIMS